MHGQGICQNQGNSKARAFDLSICIFYTKWKRRHCADIQAQSYKDFQNAPRIFVTLPVIADLNSMTGQTPEGIWPSLLLVATWSARAISLLRRGRHVTCRNLDSPISFWAPDLPPLQSGRPSLQLGQLYRKSTTSPTLPLTRSESFKFCRVQMRSS